MRFKFKIQPYQTAAADAVSFVFEGQPKSEAFTYLRDLGVTKSHMGMQSMFGDGQLEAQEATAMRRSSSAAMSSCGTSTASSQKTSWRNRLTLSDDIGACQLDVEMETGTGKTYVYTKTMFELNRLYGWSKFIIVVPSIAIREGVNKSLENTEQHFFEQYGKGIPLFRVQLRPAERVGRLLPSDDISV